jgi:small multidrug resistance pump
MKSLTSYAALALAITSELAGTALLPKADHFRNPLTTSVMAACYIASLYFVSGALDHLPLGVAHAIWGGPGIVASTLVSVLVYGQSLDLPAYIGITLIVVGVVIFQPFSNSTH